MFLTIAEAAEILDHGGIVGMPTETVYGLAANALSPLAVAKIFEAKKRPWFDPLIVHIPSVEQLAQVVEEIPPNAQKLADAFWPGPLTLVLRKRALIPDLVTSGMPSVAVRVPAHPVAQELLRLCKFPIAAPSANLFGKVSPTTAQAVLNQLEERIDGVVEGGACSVGVESTIIDCTGQQFRMLRPGGISREAIEAIIGPLAKLTTPVNENKAMPAPGTCKRHYSPDTPLEISSAQKPQSQERVGLIAFGSPKESREGFARIINLSETGDLREAATKLYAALRELDAAQLDRLVVESIPTNGLGLAINDRLKRAAAQG